MQHLRHSLQRLAERSISNSIEQLETQQAPKLACRSRMGMPMTQDSPGTHSDAFQVGLELQADVGSCVGTFYRGRESSEQTGEWVKHMHSLGVFHIHAYFTQQAVSVQARHNADCDQPMQA